MKKSIHTLFNTLILILFIHPFAHAQTWSAANGNLTTTARVGIGVTSPGEKLAVANGNISLTNGNFLLNTARILIPATSVSTPNNNIIQFSNDPFAGLGAKMGYYFNSTNTNGSLDITCRGGFSFIQNTGTNSFGPRMSIMPNGNIDFTPSENINIISQVPGKSGLKFFYLNSNNTPQASNGKILSVNAVGEVILVNDAGPIVNGSETKLTAGANVTVTGNGTTATPYVIAATAGTTNSWNLNGNTPDATSFLGTIGAQDLRLATNSTQRMVLSSVGNLGIGTPTPTTQLHTTGTVRFQGLTGTGNRLTQVDANGNLSTIGTGTTGQVLTQAANGTAWATLPVINGSETIVTAGTNITVAGTGTTTSPYVISAVNNTTAWNLTGNLGTANTNACLGTTDNAPLNFKTNGQERMVIQSDGKIKIGNVTTNTPLNDYKLYVETGILTEKVKVALKTSTNWADHVFADGYKLTPLNEVESFVKTNKHLPNVPSAEALVKNGGIDVNEMFAKQMEKIEELTLYIIEQNKQMEALKTRISQLEKQ